MSLKAFHIVFITLSIMMSLGIGGWALVNFFQEHQLADLALGLGGVAAGVALLFYGKYVVKKLKNIGYL